MKKMLIPFLCLLLCSCSSPMRPSDAMAATLAALELPSENYHIYYSDASEDTIHFPTAKIKEKLYTGGYDVDSLCESYAILIGNGATPFEIHLLMARSHSNIPDLLACVNDRKELLAERKNSTYNPDTAERTRSALSYCSGKYVVLLVTEDNDAVRKILNQYIL